MTEQVAPLAENRRPVDWVTTVFIVTYHALLLVSLPLYLIWKAPGWGLVVVSLVLAGTSLVAITAGYHRLYAHRTYNLRRPVEWIMVFFGTLATQGSILRWAHDHRLHHRHVDTDRDPYGTHKGFWHSHLLWMFEDQGPLHDRYIKDLKGRRLLQLQHRHYAWFMAGANLFVIGVLGLWTGDWIGAFVFGFLLRMFIAHHSTWFINSLAHMWGTKPYSSEHSAVNNFIIALLTYGEGYHNYHHTFAGDYRNGVRWWQFDPPKYLIWVLSKLGLASDLKRTDPLMIKKKLVAADRKLLMDHLRSLSEIDVRASLAESRASLAESVEHLSERVDALSEQLSSRIASAKTVMDRYRSLDRKRERSEVQELKARFRALKSEIARDLKQWNRLCRQILSMQPAAA